ncbi:Collagen-like protein [Orpheovirus IHUMI-LCC2]|uniref:Collagen-like protein n=1 Tax=Orpheovirus IHUMI-LCC2 TaxID=2023057 RepID=A0A2I2L3B4_9VIRU|nr:Collagen-like protein [Orpheovirus IHUMI-LCC2]SNW62028.1 Collagen-like protein [Orpheovirus IHUMI-LCC2]
MSSLITGKQILTGPGIPSSSIGNNGDQYIDTTTGDLYNKGPTSWVQVGNVFGPPGESGSEILTGSTIPLDSLGNDGDQYIDTTTNDFYQKISGTWIFKGSFSGNRILTGNGIPSSLLGSNGDYYINTTNDDYYLKINGVWNMEGNLQGQTGIPGTKGSSIISGSGPPPSIGNEGDIYINNINGDYYRRMGGVWLLQGNLEGPAGTPGIDGSNIITNVGVPLNSIGNDNDYYINIFNDDYYKKILGSWIPQGNLKGPIGFQGQSGSKILVGNGDPNISSIGEDGDYYIDRMTNNYYLKSGGVWNLQDSLQGPPESQILSSSGPPLSIYGIINDYYINNINGDYYIKIDAVTWQLKGNLRGPIGIQGQDGQGQILTGTGNPNIIPNLGQDGDQYVDNTTNNYYTKVNGTWVFNGILIGPAGVPGNPEIDPALFGDGSDGDVLIDSSRSINRDMYYNNLTVVSGSPFTSVTITTNGYRIFVRNDLRLTLGIISANGNEGGEPTNTGTVSGGAAGGGSLTVPGSQGNPSNNAPSQPTGIQFKGGSGGGGASGGNVIVTSAQNGRDSPLRNLLEVVDVRSLDGVRYTGGSGGGKGSGSTGGGSGGGGAGVVAVFARNIIVDTTFGTGFNAIGGDGQTGTGFSSGGGGGGGGGLVVIVSTTTTPLPTNVSGGQGGLSTNGNNGSPGNPGLVYRIIV